MSAFGGLPRKSTHVRMRAVSMDLINSVDLIQNFLDHHVAVVGVQPDFLQRTNMPRQIAELLAELGFFQLAGFGKIDRIDHAAMDAGFQFLKRLPLLNCVRTRCLLFDGSLGDHGVFRS